MDFHDPGIKLRSPALQADSLPTEVQLYSFSHSSVLEKVMATHSSILARISPWTEEPGGLLSMGSQRDRHVLVTEPTSTLPYTPEMKLMNNTHILKNNQNIVLAVTSRRNKRKLTCKYCLE